MEFAILFIALLLFCVHINAFPLISHQRLPIHRNGASQLAVTTTNSECERKLKPIRVGKKWPGTRPPIANLKRYLMKIDPGWGRGKFRKEVWEGEVNPVTEWWLDFAPSEEEMEALTLGYNYNNPKEYFEARGIDFEAALIEMKDTINHRLKDFVVAEQMKRDNFSMEKFDALTEKDDEMKRIAFELEFRKKDNELQMLKGQSSLDHDGETDSNLDVLLVEQGQESVEEAILSSRIES